MNSLNTNIAHSARIYDFWLGGKDNFAVDRAVAEQIAEVVPEVPAMAQANRDFMARVCRWLVAERGIRQILDIGTGIPTEPNLHQVAQQVAAETRVVYVDNDPLVLAHARALLTSDPRGRCAYLDADLSNPARILHSEELTDTLDLSRPVAVTFGSILMLVADADDPWTTVHTLMDAMPAGSYLVITHPAADMDPDKMALVTAVTAQRGVTFVPRGRAQVARFFDGYTTVEPGLVPLLSWRPAEVPENPEAVYYWVGVAQK